MTTTTTTTTTMGDDDDDVPSEREEATEDVRLPLVPLVGAHLALAALHQLRGDVAARAVLQEGLEAATEARHRHLVGRLVGEHHRRVV